MIDPEHQRRAYLQSMGIDVWLPRDARDPGVFDAEAGTLETADLSWDELRQCAVKCSLCELANSRKQIVFGAGNLDASWMIIGESPGAEEDRQGEPFVGRDGQMLNEMLRAIGQSRESVYIANVVKCRPPNNRAPQPAEAAACRAYLQRQISLVRPDVILAVGEITAQNLLQTDEPLERMRGREHKLEGVRLVVTYHPANLLSSPSQKPKVWSDLCFANPLSMIEA